MFTYPYQILEAEIKTRIPEIKEVDWYLQQDSTSDKNASIYTAPLVYFEFNLSSELRSHGKEIQSAIVDITVHLLTENTRDKGSKLILKSGIEHSAMFDKVYKTLQNFNAKLSQLDTFAALAGTDQDQTVFNSMNRVGILNPHATRKTMVKSTQTFRCVVWDHAALKQYTKVTPDLQVDADLLIHLDNNTGVTTWDDSWDDSFGD
ncbi:hypothetical protein ACFQ21_00205 [Ohtaekwangia kribbensis]|uniref:Uncharacterized protein n=1 Tax=Ohtaekwangia kribbensis TaxID=688913 RepID=A0ABW3JV86_9BACT